MSGVSGSAPTLEPFGILSSAARTTDTDSSQLQLTTQRGIRLFIDITAISGTGPSLTVKVQVKNPLSNGWVDLQDATTAALNAVGLTTMSVYPGMNQSANVRISTAMSSDFRVRCTIGGVGTSVTFSVHGVKLP